MPRKLLSQPFEKGLTETWQWKTDVLTPVVRRGEQRVSLLEYPNETLGLSMGFGDDGQQVFDDEAAISGEQAIVRSLNDLIACRGEVEIPLWPLADDIVSASWTTGTQVAALALSSTTPFFVAVGEDVLVRIADEWFRAEVTVYTQSAGTLSVDFGANTGAAIADLEEVAPLRTGLVSQSSMARLGRASPTGETSVSVLLDRSQGRTSFTGGVTLATGPSGWPVIAFRGIQDSLELRVDQGLQTIDTATGFPFYVTHWTEAAISADFRDHFDRYRSGERLRYWRTLFATVRGSQGAFWFPTRRGEFTVVSSDNDAQIVVLEGRQYFDLWSETNLKAVALDSLVGHLKVLQVTACELSGGNSVLEFGESWFVPAVLQCSLALPCRLDGDSVTLEHGAGTALKFNVVSVVYDYPVSEEDVDWDGLLARIDASVSTGVEFGSGGRYVELAVSGEIGGTATVIAGASGPAQTAQNGLRAMTFEDDEFDPTLGGTLDVHVWADTLLAQFRLGTASADLQIQGEGEVPRIYILPGGDPEVPEKHLGEARYVRSWTSIGSPLGPSRATAPVRYEDGYELHFADTTYFAPYWDPVSVGLNDRSGNGNHLVTDAANGLQGYQLSGLRYILDHLEGGFGGVIESSFAVPVADVPKVFAYVGWMYNMDLLSGTTPFIVGSSGGTDWAVSMTTTGEIVVNRGSDDTSTVAVGHGDWFLLLVAFDGAASELHLLKNSETDWATEALDAGSGTGNLSGLTVGMDYLRTHAILVADAPPDLIAYREGLARHYGFQSLVSQTGMQATPADVDGWAVLHDGTTDYVLSVVLEIEEPGPATITLFEVLNDAENGGLRWEWVKATSELVVTLIGTAGTFTETFDLSVYADDAMVVELAIDVSSEAGILVVNGESVGLITGVGFTYSTVQQNALTFGTDRGWTLCEILLRAGSTLSTDELTEKWLEPSGFFALLDESDDELLIEGNVALYA